MKTLRTVTFACLFYSNSLKYSECSLNQLLFKNTREKSHIECVNVYCIAII